MVSDDGTYYYYYKALFIARIGSRLTGSISPFLVLYKQMRVSQFTPGLHHHHGRLSVVIISSTSCLFCCLLAYCCYSILLSHSHQINGRSNTNTH